jgi:hypothetical protein
MHKLAITFFIFILFFHWSESIVPLPQTIQTGREEIGIFPSQFTFNTTSTSLLLKRAMTRIFHQTFAWKQYRRPVGPLLRFLTINVASNSEHLALGLHAIHLHSFRSS